MNFSLDRRAHSETGPLRKNNQDSGFSSPNLLVVADGMGGAAAGDLASTVAISLVERVDERHTGEDMLSVLAGAVSRANDKLADLVAADHALDGMGTTVTGAMFSGTQLGFVHIGDSRAYVLRDGELDRITTDHSWVMSLVAEGKITEAEAETHPHRNLLLKVLNGQPTHQPDTFLFDVRAGDRLLLCSDGLCGFASDATIATHLAKPDLDEAMDGLVKAAYAGGGADNITIVLADVVEQDDELDAGTPAVIGAALTTEIPEVPEAGVDLGDDEDDEPEDETRIPRAPAPVVIDPETMESLRYAPTLVKRRRWIAPVVSTLLIVAALVGIGFGGAAYAKTQYYVGADADKVAIYNGVPGQLLGVKFQRKTEDTGIPVADLPPFYQSRVRNNISASDLDGARATVSELRALAAACRDKRGQQSTPPSSTPSSSPPTTSPGTTSPSQGSSSAGVPTASTSNSPTLSQPASTTPGQNPDEEC